MELEIEHDMRTAKFLFLAFVDFTVWMVIGTIAGSLVGIGIVYLQETGILTLWKSLDSPVKFIRIVDVNPDIILAKSVEDKLYKWSSWDCQFNKKCNWVETSEKQVYRDELYITARKHVCQQEGFVSPKYMPGNVVECVFTRRVATEYSRLVYYATLDDETIWHWLKETDPYGDLLFLILFGILTGIIAGIVVVYRKEARSKYD